jgi:hypothetical protein
MHLDTIFRQIVTDMSLMRSNFVHDVTIIRIHAIFRQSIIDKILMWSNFVHNVTIACLERIGLIICDMWVPIELKIINCKLVLADKHKEDVLWFFLALGFHVKILVYFVYCFVLISACMCYLVRTSKNNLNG